MQDQAPGLFRTRFYQNRNHDRVLAVRPRDHGPLQTDARASGLLPRMLPQPKSRGRHRGLVFRFPYARKTLVVLAILLALYVALCAGFYVAMLQPPDVFGQIIAKTPFPVMMVLPFETLWNRARGGRLKPGDLAPDFRLPT